MTRQWREYAVKWRQVRNRCLKELGLQGEPLPEMFVNIIIEENLHPLRQNKL